ncbi:GNAT family N-acetyltransferase [uncultured Tolumonas sp.]|uniref:GNAT family N-acetyltransferase n=1 Tax=uncultured Tolumonas sp. TaxID=263765 RepID=UPI002930E480|nr:GNAT family N-acetyltransferase [uncultured Tolumonas sp.]
MKIQKVENIDLESVRKLIADVSEYDVLPKFNTQGKEAYRSNVLPSIDTTFNTNEFISIKAVIDNEIVGFGALRSGNYLTHLFVSKSVQGKGIGKKLLATLLNSTDAQEITLRASVNAVSFYRCNGFKTCGDESEFNGIHFVPMLLQRT